MNTNVCFKTSFKRSLCLSLFGQRNQTPQTHGVSVIVNVLQFIVPLLATSGAEITHFTKDFVLCHSYLTTSSASVCNPPADAMMHDSYLSWTLTGSGNNNISLQGLKVMMMITWYMCEFPAPLIPAQRSLTPMLAAQHIMPAWCNHMCSINVHTVTPSESAERLWNLVHQLRLQG